MGKKSKSKTPAEMQDNIAVGIGGSFLGPLQTDPEAIETARGRQLHLGWMILGGGCLFCSEGIVEVGSRFWLYKVSHSHMAELLFQKSYPNEEFFSETPSPQNLEDDVPINLED
ncbi:unnamed protein product [Prunus armeniaca]